MVVVSRSHAALLTEDEDAGADCPSPPNYKESSETEEDDEQWDHASSFLLQVMYPWSCTYSGSLPKRASSLALTRFRKQVVLQQSR